MVDLGINETLQTGAVRQPPLPCWIECGAVSYLNAETSILENRPTEVPNRL